MLEKKKKHMNHFITQKIVIIQLLIRNSILADLSFDYYEKTFIFQK